MTPKEKAEELYNLIFNKFSDYKGIFLEYKSKENCVKKCTIIMIEEIIDSIPEYKWSKEYTPEDFWEQVKQEINNL